MRIETLEKAKNKEIRENGWLIFHARDGLLLLLGYDAWYSPPISGPNKFYKKNNVRNLGALFTNNQSMV